MTPEPTGSLDVGRLFVEHAQLVRRAVIRMAGPGADVEDLVQEVFLVAVRKADTFAGRSQATTWLYGITLRVISQRRRRARLWRFFGLDDAPALVEERTPDRLFEHREASTTVYRVLDKLSERKRTVFLLYELEGCSGEEIATLVGCPLKTVWTRLFHARHEFAQHVARLEKRDP